MTGAVSQYALDCRPTIIHEHSNRTEIETVMPLSVAESGSDAPALSDKARRRLTRLL